MATFVDVEDIDTMNLRLLHGLTVTLESTIKFLQHLKLLQTKPSDKDSCPKQCNDWYLANIAGRGNEGILFTKNK